MAIESAHRRAVRTETLVSIGINALVPAAIIWIIGKAPPQTLTGPDAIAGDMMPAAGLATLLMTLLLTRIMRARVSRGSVPPLDWPRTERGVMRYIPQSLIARAVVLAVVAVLLLVPLGLLVTALLDLLPMTRIGFLLFNICFGALVGLVMTRFVVLPAMADPPRLVPGSASLI